MTECDVMNNLTGKMFIVAFANLSAKLGRLPKYMAVASASKALPGISHEPEDEMCSPQMG